MENKVFQKLKKIRGIQDVHILFGEFDIITKIESKSFEKIGRAVMAQIRSIDGVQDTKTFPCTNF